MADRPDAGELLTVARDALLDSLLPLLPADAHYTARMIANANAIAQRERVAAPPQLATLALLAGVPADAAAVAVDAAVADRLRAGDFDAESERRLHAALTARTRARLAVSNPKALSSGPSA